jgi:hypothetical protein
MLTDKQCYVKYVETYQVDIYLSLEDFRREVARWLTHWIITKRNDLPSTLNDLSTVALATDMVNKTHSFINIVSIEG